MERVVAEGRVAGEKAVLADEFVVLGQISGGDGIRVIQSDGRYYDENGIAQYANKDGVNNVVINRLQPELYLEPIGEELITYTDYATMLNMYDQLLSKSVIYINGLAYGSDYFDIQRGTDPFGTANQLIIKWQGPFVLEDTDEIIWRI